MSASELGFLIDLLLNHKLPTATKKLVADRIKDVEENLSAAGIAGRIASPLPKMVPAQQAPSTQAKLAKHAVEIDPGGEIKVAEAVAPVENVAQTAVAAVAIASREKIMAGKMELDKTTGRPRKW